MRNKSLCKPWEHHLSRREWLSGVTAAAGAGALLQSAFAEEAKKKRKQVLFIWIDGGMSQLESWDPKPGTQFGGPFRAIPTSVPGIHVSELLPRTAKQMHHMALVRSLCTKDNSHSAGVARIQRGDPKNRGVTYPFFGSAVANLIGSEDSKLPPYVWIKPGSGGFKLGDAGFLGAKYAPLAFGNGKPPEKLLPPDTITPEDNQQRNELRKLIDDRYSAQRKKESTEANGYVFDMALELAKRKDLFDETTFSRKDRERYGTHEIGRHMLVARKMLEAGITFVKVNSYGWDTHGDNFNGHRNMVPKFDQAFAAIIEDLAERKMLDDVLVIAISEFGRTPRINGHIGRDHWPEAWSVAMAGCGLKKGIAVGKTNDKGTFVSTEEYDIGHMFHTWFQALGIKSERKKYYNDGQPLPIAHEECHAVKEVLS